MAIENGSRARSAVLRKPEQGLRAPWLAARPAPTLVTLTVLLSGLMGALLSIPAGCTAPSSGGGTPVASLQAPSAITAVAADRQVMLSWPAVSGAARYRVYWSVFAGVTTANGVAADASGATFVHTGLTNSTTYYYVVTAANDQAESAASPQISATPLGVTPSTPGLLTLTADNGRITISWNTVSDADSYNLYWSLFPGVRGTPILGLPASTTSYVQNGLTNGTMVYYQLTAVSAGGESPPTAQQGKAPGFPNPGAPTGLFLSSTSTSVRLSWNFAAGATSYNVYGASASGVTATVASLLAEVFSTTFTDRGLLAGTTRYYRVTAMAVGFESLPSSEQSIVTAKTADRLYVQDGFSAMLFAPINANGALGTPSGLGFQPIFFPYRLGNMLADAKGRFIFGTLEDLFDRDTSVLDGFVVDGITGLLSQLPNNVSPFTAVSGLALDHGGNFLFVGEPLVGGITAYSIDPNFGVLVAVPSGPTTTPGSAPFALASSPTANFLYGLNGDAANGLHAVLAYAYDGSSGVLSAVGGSPFALASPGNGGDALVVEGTGTYLYVLDQYPTGAPTHARLTPYAISSGTGSLTPVAVPLNLSAPLAGALGYRLVCDPAGRWVFLSTVPAMGDNAGTMLVYVFAIDPASGALTPQDATTGAQGPSNPLLPFPAEAGRLQSVGPMMADPSGRFLYFSDNQQSIAGFAINPTTGALTSVPGSPTSIPTGEGTFSSQANLRMVMVPGQ